VDVLRLLAEQAETRWDVLLPVEAFRAGPDRPWPGCATWARVRQGTCSRHRRYVRGSREL